MKKVLFVATVVKTHIMEFHIPYLQMFKEMGWETAVASRNDYENPVDCVIPFCDNFYDIPFERNPLKPGNYKAYKALKKIIDEGNYDIIHCHTPVGAMLTRLAARGVRKKGTKVIYTAHGFHFYKGAPLLNWLIYYPVEKVLSRYTDVLITINREDYERAKTFSAKRVEYVAGVGIDTAKFGNTVVDAGAKKEEIGIPAGAFMLLSVGELNKNKNHEVVVRALAKLGDSDIHYAVAGRGDLTDTLNNLAGELGIGNNVHLLGYRNDTAELLKAADLFIHPSFREGLPVAVMEAMASGLPVICTDIRGSADLVENRVNGIISDNNPDAMAEAIAEIRSSPELLASYSAASREKVSELDIFSIREQVREIYLSL